MLTWRPHLPKKVATKSPGFNIIEEYTLDEANASVGNEKGDTNPVRKAKLGLLLFNVDNRDAAVCTESLPDYSFVQLAAMVGSSTVQDFLKLVHQYKGDILCHRLGNMC